MSGSKEQTKCSMSKLQSLASKSETEFLKEIGKYSESATQEIYLRVLATIEKATTTGDLANFKRSTTLLRYFRNLRGETNDLERSLKFENLVLSSCRHNQLEILKYLLENLDTGISGLSRANGETSVKPDEVDDESHNAFYYAMRSNNIKILETLIKKWPNNYFQTRAEELDTILTQAYSELKLKNISLSKKMEIFVESTIIDLRFFSDSSDGQATKYKVSIDNVKERITLVLDNINLLKTEYDVKKVDARFLCIAKFITQNIYVLKRQLRSTYDRLPWEEMEFCLVGFICSYTKRQEINLFYRFILSKNRILSHLQHFARNLERERDLFGNKDINRSNSLPLKREDVVGGITVNFPEFTDLYNDFKDIRDVTSLEKIHSYIRLALQADSKVKDEQLIIVRALQVIGEYLKNTLESPKLSNETSELLLILAPNSTRKIILDLRNSLSHAYSLSKRLAIEETRDSNFFVNIQNDIMKISNVIANILFDKKIKLLVVLMKKLIASDSLGDMQKVVEDFRQFYLEELGSIVKSNSNESKLLEHGKIAKLIEDINSKVIIKTEYESGLFKKINDILQRENSKNGYENNYILVFAMLQGIIMFINSNRKIDNNAIRTLKYSANEIMKNISPKIEPQSLEEIARVLKRIYESITSRSITENDEIRELCMKVFYLVQFEVGNIKWIEELREKLDAKYSQLEQKQKNRANMNYNNHLNKKLTTLQTILKDSSLGSELIEQLPPYTEKKQVTVEMLVLDILSILDSTKKNLANDLHFLDNSAPLLIGKCLRNHLAHGNAVLDILPFDACTAVRLNAQKFTAEIMTSTNKKIGKFYRDDLLRLKSTFNRILSSVTNQDQMFAALEKGNMEELKICIKRGADIYATGLDSQTALHFAAKGLNVDTITFILDQNSSFLLQKDVDGQSALHIAAANGRTTTVQYLLKKGIPIDDRNNAGSTALHLAAQNGHIDVVQLFFTNGANTRLRNMEGTLPVHDTAYNKCFDIVKILLEKEENVDKYTTLGGYTCLHIAAEVGDIETVTFLLTNQANVQAKNDRDGIPLHVAALNGHAEVVKLLISKGSDVNSRVFDGCTPLHYATETGREEIVAFLIENGANVNVADNVYNNYPLHYATLDGHFEIVKALLKNGADINVRTVSGETPLHNAAVRGHIDIVDLLLKYGASMEARDIRELTPLDAASEGGHESVMSFLIKQGASVNAKNIFGRTALHAAAESGKKSAAVLLISEGADVNIMNNAGYTPLHISSQCAHVEVVQSLINEGAYVNAKTAISRWTPLHLAVGLEGFENVIIKPIETKIHFDASWTGEKLASRISTVQILIKSGANIRLKDKFNCAPLHLACMTGNTEVVENLIEAGADVTSLGLTQLTPLDLAVESGYADVVKVLIKRGATVNGNVGGNVNKTALCTAVKKNHVELVQVLLSAGADVNCNNGEPLMLAIFLGNSNVTNTLLKHKSICLDPPLPDNYTFLHLAARNGNLRIVEALISKGININATTNNSKLTPLYAAAESGHDAIVKVLLANGAKVNIKDNKNRIAVELAIARGHSKVVEILVEHESFDIHAKAYNGFSLLHIAADNGELEILKLLVNKGADVHARNLYGSKPIHIAAREGHTIMVEYFLNSGFSIHDVGISSNSLLHYAATTGKCKTAKYLMDQKADVNVPNVNMSRPIHIAAGCGSKDFVMLLLQNGAMYNCSDKFNKNPWEVASNRDVIHLLTSTDKLFAAVKRNSPLEVECCVREGAFVDARNADNATALHHASWKGYSEVATVFMKSKANPNAIGKGGNTPLHYAAKFGHLDIVKTLLSHGAMFDVTADTGKTPLDLTKDQAVESLLKLVHQSFRDVKNGNSLIIKKLNNIKDFTTVKAVLNARTRENITLIVEAIKSNFPKVGGLKEILQGNVSSQIRKAELLATQDKYLEALAIYNDVLEKRKEVLGIDDPGTLDIRNEIAVILYKQGNYKKALVMIEEIYNIQADTLGPNHEESLKTRSFIALVMHRQGKYEEALPIFSEVVELQKKILGLKHSDTLYTQNHMALTLDKLERFEEALAINYEVLESRKATFGRNHPITLSIYNNIAMVLSNQGKADEAMQIYKKVYETRKRVLGPNHSDTLRALYNVATVLVNQKKGDEAVTALEEVLDAQRKALGPDHVDTVNTQYNLGVFLFQEGKFINALKALSSCRDRRKHIFGPNHPTVIDNDAMMQIIDKALKTTSSSSASEILVDHSSKIIAAANDGNVKLVQDLLRCGCDVNSSDADCRTLLHFAANTNRKDIVNLLLKHGADIFKVTKNGNSALHTATSGGHKDIVEVLLQHVKKSNPSKSKDFINAKTASTGSTSLHVAAKRGFFDIVKLLLSYGATYNATDSQSNKPPIAYSKDPRITDFFGLVDDVFTCAKTGDLTILNKLQRMQSADCLAALNAHNTLGQTAIKVATINKHQELLKGLVKCLQKFRS